MGEIKSTLDLVMEKTKHLSMTDEEKLKKEKEDVLSAIKGMVQKYQDQILSPEMFKNELNELHQHYSFKDKDVLLSEIFSRINLESDNSRLFELMREMFDMDIVKLEEIERQHLDELKKTAENRIEDVKNQINEKYSISGSAVVPNIEADASWQAEMNNIMKRFYSELEEVKSELAK